MHLVFMACWPQGTLRLWWPVLLPVNEDSALSEPCLLFSDLKQFKSWGLSWTPSLPHLAAKKELLGILFLLKIFFKIRVWLITFCQFLLYTKVTQLYIYIYSFSYMFLSHVPSQVIRYSSLCYRAGPHCLSTPSAVFLYLLTLNSQSNPATTSLFTMAF